MWEVGSDLEERAATPPGRPEGEAQPAGLGSEGRAFGFLLASSSSMERRDRDDAVSGLPRMGLFL